MTRTRPVAQSVLALGAAASIGGFLVAALPAGAAPSAKPTSGATTVYTVRVTPGATLSTLPALTTVASLDLPAGSYAITAKGSVVMAGANIVECDLVAGQGTDQVFIQSAATNFTEQILVANVAAAVAAQTRVDLKCGVAFATPGSSISRIQLTAISAATVVDQS